MCMIENLDGSQAIFIKNRKAVKAHKCIECRRIISPGEEYEYYVGSSDGDIFNAKTCVQCVAARSWVSINCHGWVFGGIIEDLEEHWKYEYSSLDLGRKIVGMRRQWKKFYGDGLMEPLPLTKIPVDKIRKVA